MVCDYFTYIGSRMACCTAGYKFFRNVDCKFFIVLPCSSFGGTYMIQTGANIGSEVFGQDPLWLAWVTDLINFKNQGDMDSYNNLLESVTPARFNAS